MEMITTKEQDMLGEIANISIGNAATTLSMMVGHNVDIDTPKVSIIDSNAVLDDYEKTCIFVQIHYIKGLSGNNVFVLKEQDVLAITDLMMGGSGLNVTGEIGELQLSAASEAMNQMMGTAATSMAVLFKFPVDISTPDVSSIDVDSVKKFQDIFEASPSQFVKIAFRMEIEGVMTTSMIQYYPLDFAKEMCSKVDVTMIKESA